MSEEQETKAWCYAFPDEKGTHYGPIHEPSIPRLLERIRQYYRQERLDAGVEFWLTDSKSYLYPPKEGSGVDVYRFDKELGWRKVRTT